LKVAFNTVTITLTLLTPLSRGHIGSVII
jgi:hypothetical protein